jgi:hypothetical protein
VTNTGTKRTLESEIDKHIIMLEIVNLNGRFWQNITIVNILRKTPMKTIQGVKMFEIFLIDDSMQNEVPYSI